MKKSLLPLLLGITLTIPGCVPSLNPLYTDKDLVFDPALVGVWGDKEDNPANNWTFEKAGEHSYKLHCWMPVGWANCPKKIPR